MNDKVGMGPDDFDDRGSLKTEGAQTHRMKVASDERKSYDDPNKAQQFDHWYFNEKTSQPTAEQREAFAAGMVYGRRAAFADIADLAAGRR